MVFRLYQRWLWIVERPEVELDMTLVEAAFLGARHLAHRILPKQPRYCACNAAVEQVDCPAVQVHGRLRPTKPSRPRGSQTWRRSKVDHVDTTGQRTSWLFPLSIAASRRWGCRPTTDWRGGGRNPGPIAPQQPLNGHRRTAGTEAQTRQSIGCRCFAGDVEARDAARWWAADPPPRCFET